MRYTHRLLWLSLLLLSSVLQAREEKPWSLNFYLDGNTFRSSHFVHHRDVVADIAIGLAGSYRKIRFSYAHIYRMKEFSGQRKAQFYGSFSLSYQHLFR